MCRLGKTYSEMYGEFNLEPKNGACVKNVPKMFMDPKIISEISCFPWVEVKHLLLQFCTFSGLCVLKTSVLRSTGCFIFLTGRYVLRTGWLVKQT